LSRYLFGRHTEGVQEMGKSVKWPHRRGHRVTAEVDIQLTVGEAVPDAVCPVHHQSGLAHPCGAVDRGYDDRGRLVVTATCKLVEDSQLTVPATEAGHLA